MLGSARGQSGTMNDTLSSLHPATVADTATEKSADPDSLAPDPLVMHIDSIIDFGRTLLGKPYRYRGAAPWPMDCSGYMNHIFNNFGYKLPRSSREIASALPEVPRNEVRKGDMLFFRGRNSGNPVVGHVGIVVDVTPDGILMLHSSTSRGIIIENISSVDYYKRRWVKVGRPEYRLPEPKTSGTISDQ